MFPTLESQKHNGGVTVAQSAHLALLKKSHSPLVDGEDKDIILFSLLKYMTNISIVSRNDCKEGCIGSLMVKDSKAAILYDVLLHNEGGILYDIKRRDRRKSQANLESNDEDYKSITIAVMQPDKKHACLVEQSIPPTGLLGLTQALSLNRAPSDPKIPLKIQKSFLSDAKPRIATIPIGSKDLPVFVPYNNENCGPYSNQRNN